MNSSLARILYFGGDLGSAVLQFGGVGHLPRPPNQQKGPLTQLGGKNPHEGPGSMKEFSVCLPPCQLSGSEPRLMVPQTLKLILRATFSIGGIHWKCNIR